MNNLFLFSGCIKHKILNQKSETNIVRNMKELSTMIIMQLEVKTIKRKKKTFNLLFVSPLWKGKIIDKAYFSC